MNMQSAGAIEERFQLWYKELCVSNPTHRSVARGWYMAVKGGMVAQLVPIATAKLEVRNVDEYVGDKQKIAELECKLRIAQDLAVQWERLVLEKIRMGALPLN